MSSILGKFVWFFQKKILPFCEHFLLCFWTPDHELSGICLLLLFSPLLILIMTLMNIVRHYIIADNTKLMMHHPCPMCDPHFAAALIGFFLDRHIVSSKKFLRTSSSPHKTLPNDKYDAPKEVCGERKLFYRPLKKWGQKQIFDVRALTLCS